MTNVSDPSLEDWKKLHANITSKWSPPADPHRAIPSLVDAARPNGLLGDFVIVDIRHSFEHWLSQLNERYRNGKLGQEASLRNDDVNFLRSCFSSDTFHDSLFVVLSRRNEISDFSTEEIEDAVSTMQHNIPEMLQAFDLADLKRLATLCDRYLNKALARIVNDRETPL